MYEKLIDTRHCPAGGGVFVRHADRELAVFHLQDPERFVVTDNACPHAGGNLAGGTLAGATVACPVHHWVFDLVTGRCPGTRDVHVKRYACRVQDGVLFADLTGPLPRHPPPGCDF